MNKELISGKRIKDMLVRKTLPTVLAGSMIFGGALASEAKAYSLDKPEMGYEDYLSYDGIKVYINGRYVEFSESSGYPFVENGSTMIPLRAVSEAFGSKIIWNPDTQTVTVGKYDKEVLVSVGSSEMKVKDLDSNSTSVVSIAKSALIRNGRTYIPLRSLFECFGLSVRWDSESKTAYIETDINSLENININGKEISIKDIDLDKVSKVIYDGEEVDKSYVKVLQSNEQYKVVEEEGVVQIFSYQFLSNLNYIYGVDKLKDEKMKGEDVGKIVMWNSTEEDRDFFARVYLTTDFTFRTFTTRDINRKPNEASNNDLFSNYEVGYPDYTEREYQEMMVEVRKMVEEVKSKTDDKREQVKLVTKLFKASVKYNENAKRNDAYGALVLKETACGGFACGYLLIMEELGIPSLYYQGVVNFGKTVGAHAWNHIYIDGEWYLCDPTTSSTFHDINSSTYVQNEAYDEVDQIKLTYKFN